MVGAVKLATGVFALLILTGLPEVCVQAKLRGDNAGLFGSVLALAFSVTTLADAAGLGLAFATAVGGSMLAGGLIVTDTPALEVPPAFCTVTVKFSVVAVLTFGAVKVAIEDVGLASVTCRASEGDCV